MASKRKSTVPCMIPSKSKHLREEIILGSLPELLPTIPEDRILSISGEETSHVSSSSRSESGSETQKGGTYSCVTCRFESRDLNYFLDHMHNCHLDFRAQPTFYCLNCRVSVVRFEALALHNANSHPKIMEGLITASLSVNKRDGVTTVEQSLFTDSGEDHRESGISLTKTPIAKMMKGKGEHKKIVISHTVEVLKIDMGKDVDTNVPELQNGALSFSGAPAMPRNAVNHVVTSTASDQIFHQHSPSLYSSLSSDSIKDLPKVMIPLSSIPTYDAAMDTSSFLKTSFGKFPYPTKAELCYLTVVSEFPEEQIKLWFTAQRLKQGISWSPEEIEEARRKMFNTVFQGGAPQKQPAAPRQGNHIVSHHTAHPGSKGSNFQVTKLPFGNVKARPVGATQASSSTNAHVTRVSYSAPVAPAMFPSIIRTAQVQSKSTEPTVEPDKSNGLEAAGNSGCVSSTSSIRSSSSCSSSSSISSYSSINGNEAIAKKCTHSSSPADGANCMAPSNNYEHCVFDNNDKPNIKSNSSLLGSSSSNGATSEANSTTTSKSNPSCNNEDSGPERADSKPNNDPTKTNHNSISTKSTNDSISNQNHTNESLTESTSTTVITKSNSSITDEGKNKDFSIKGMSILQQLIKEDDQFIGDKSLSELKGDPVKINFKRLKMNKPEATSDINHQEHKADVEVSACHSSFSPPWSHKTPQQLHVLRQAFSSTRWPSSLQYEELSIQTGLPKSEVVRWFSDSRYSYKNGQLKWLETYQRPPSESEDTSGHTETEAEKGSAAASKEVIGEDAQLEAEPNAGQRAVWQDSYSPLPVLTRSEGSSARAEQSAQLGVPQDPWADRREDLQQQMANKSLIEPQRDTNQDRYLSCGILQAW
uniref:Si:ch211-232b12.5 n=1 Tax=Oryzias latipes TaxID=8090 RepID=A0A3P9LDI9_ORYLA